ncbi:MAG: DsbA family protein [Henriciella sp.]|nr:DsbA family protein [Henriciella sp.]
MSKPRVYHSFRSPFSRLGLHLLVRAGVDFDLIPLFEWPDSVDFMDPVSSPAKRAYFGYDAVRMTSRMGLPIAIPNPFEVDLIPAARVQLAARTEGKDIAFALTASDARWGDGKNISNPDVLLDCAKQNGLSAAFVDRALNDTSIDAALAECKALINEDEPFGVPFAVYGNAKYWGHDRFALLLEDLGLKAEA